MITSTPEFKDPGEYREFMRSGAGSNIKPGSEEERLIMSGFRASQDRRQGTTEAARRERVKAELKARAGVETGTSYVRPEISQEIHRLGEDLGEGKEITVTKEGGEAEEIPVRTPGASPVS